MYNTIVSPQLVSVIVPVYNRENDLTRCVESVLNQTYTALEIILVDDGSRDASPALCERFAKRDARVRVRRLRENRGVSVARNMGIEMARGTWLCFADADDEMLPTMVETLLALAVEKQTRVAMCNYFLVDGSERVEHTLAGFSAHTAGLLQGAECYGGVLPKDSFECYAWNKLFHKSLFEGKDGVRFDAAFTMCEDRVFTAQILKQTDRLAYSQTACYIHTLRPDSLSRSGWRVKLNSLEARRKVIEMVPAPYNMQEQALYYTLLPRVAFEARQMGMLNIYRRLRDIFRGLDAGYRTAYKAYAKDYPRSAHVLVRLAGRCFPLACFAWRCVNSKKAHFRHIGR